MSKINGPPKIIWMDTWNLMDFANSWTEWLVRRDYKEQNFSRFIFFNTERVIDALHPWKWEQEEDGWNGPRHAQKKMGNVGHQQQQQQQQIQQMIRPKWTYLSTSKIFLLWLSFDPSLIVDLNCLLEKQAYAWTRREREIFWGPNGGLSG